MTDQPFGDENTLQVDDDYSDLYVARRVIKNYEGKIIAVKRGATPTVYKYNEKCFTEDLVGDTIAAVISSVEEILENERLKVLEKINEKKEQYQDDKEKRNEAISTLEDRYKKLRRMLLSANKLSAVKRLTIELALREDDFDIDPDLFVTENYVLNLNDLSIVYNHSPKYHVTMISPVDYNPAADAPKFCNLISHMFQDSEVKEYVLQVIASSMLRCRRDEYLFLIHGIMANNGKTTLLQAIAETLGDYACWMDPKAFSRKRTGNATQPELMAAVKKMLAIVDEPDRDEMDIGALKNAANSGKMSMRQLYQATQTVRWTATILHLCNQLPEMDLKDAGAMRRIVVIPVTTQISEEMKNADRTYNKANNEKYGMYLAVNEGSGILNILLDALDHFIANGYKLPEMPQEIRKATDEYIMRHNPVKRFIDERTTQKPVQGTIVTPYIKPGDLYEAFKAYCMFTLGQDKVMLKGNFYDALRALGYEQEIIKDSRTERNPIRAYDSIRILKEGEKK